MGLTPPARRRGKGCPHDEFSSNGSTPLSASRCFSAAEQAAARDASSVPTGGLDDAASQDSDSRGISSTPGRIRLGAAHHSRALIFSRILERSPASGGSGRKTQGRRKGTADQHPSARSDSQPSGGSPAQGGRKVKCCYAAKLIERASSACGPPTSSDCACCTCCK